LQQALITRNIAVFHLKRIEISQNRGLFFQLFL